MTGGGRGVRTEATEKKKIQGWKRKSGGGYIYSGKNILILRKGVKSKEFGIF